MAYRILYFAGFVLFGLIGLFLATSTWPDWRAWAATGEFEQVDGVVLGFKAARELSKDTPPKYEVSVRYRFEVDGKTYTSERFHVDGSKPTVKQPDLKEIKDRYAIDGKVRVLFPSGHPERSIVDPTATSAMKGLAIGIAVLLGLTIYCLAQALRRTRSQPSERPASGAVPVVLEPSLPDAILLPLVARLEREFADDPVAYQRSLFRFGLLGYLVLGGFLATLAVLIALTAWLAFVSETHYATGKLLVVLAFALFIGVRAILVSPPARVGLRVTPDDAPELFRVLEELRAKAHAPPIDEVYLDEQMNASVSEYPRFGLLGGWRNRVTIGVPLLVSMTPQEMRSVIAHEFGHLSARHGRSSRATYRLRATWRRMAIEIARRNAFGTRLVLPFYRWFAARLAARGLVMSRAFELEADALAVEIAGPRTAADAMAREALAWDRYEHEFSAALTKRARVEAEPPADFHAFLREVMLGPCDRDLAERTLRAALAVDSDPRNTHPCLRERIAAMGVDARTPPPLDRVAADEFLGPRFREIAERAAENWREGVAERWHDAHEMHAQRVARLAELDAAPSRDQDEEFERAALREEVDGGAAALPLYRAIVARDPACAPAIFAIGRVLVESNDDAGFEFLLDAVRLDRKAAGAAFELIAGRAWRAGRVDEAREWQSRARLERDEERLAMLERSNIAFDGRFDPHGLAPEITADLATLLRRVPGLHRAWLVRRRVEHRIDEPYYVVGVTAKSLLVRWFGIGAKARAVKLVEATAAAIGVFPCLIFGLDAQPRKARKQLDAVRGSRIVE